MPSPNHLLSPSTMTNATKTHPSNIYTYQPQNVLISYGVTLLFVILANALGFFP